MSGQQTLTSEAVLEKFGGRLTGKTILITGVSPNSIAGELALQVSAHDPALMIISARKESNASPVINKIRTDRPNIPVIFLNIDLSDLGSIRSAAWSIANSVPKIDHLVCVAGVMAPPYSQTIDCIETQFGVNYVANFELVRLLLPKVQAAGPNSSIIIVSSSAVRLGKVNFDDVGFSGGEKYDPTASYCQSNAARTMFAKLLARKLKGTGIRVFSVDPGSVETGLLRHLSPEFLEVVTKIRETGTMTDLDGKVWPAPARVTKSEGAATIITGMVDPSISSSNGAFLNNNAVADEELHSHILNEQNWERLWTLSEELVGHQLLIPSSSLCSSRKAARDQYCALARWPESSFTDVVKTLKKLIC